MSPALGISALIFLLSAIGAVIYSNNWIKPRWLFPVFFVSLMITMVTTSVAGGIQSYKETPFVSSSEEETITILNGVPIISSDTENYYFYTNGSAVLQHTPIFQTTIKICEKGDIPRFVTEVWSYPNDFFHHSSSYTTFTIYIP